MNAPTIKSNAEAGVRSWTELRIDPPKVDGPQVGDSVEYWEGESCSGNPFCGIVTLVGPNARVSIAGLLPTTMALHSVDGAIPADDVQYKGKLPKIYRYQPSRSNARLRNAEAEIARLKDKVDILEKNFEAMFQLKS
jgi:hypothetical protein